MIDYDPDKLRLFTTEENFNPAYVVSTFRQSVHQLRQIVEQMNGSPVLRFSKDRIISAKDYLEAFERTILAYQSDTVPGKLSNKQQMDILVMIEDVIRGKRECTQFQMTRSGHALREVFSSKVFELDFQTKNKQQDK